MTITFYTTADSPKKLVKSLTPIGTARALAPLGQVDVLNPVIVVAWDNTNGDKVINANYAYIDTFKRYYWITTGIDTAGRIVVTGNVDYLMSWAEGIKKCPCTVVRAELGKPTDVTDTKYPIQPNKYIIQGVDFDESLYLRDVGFTAYTVIVTR